MHLGIPPDQDSHLSVSRVIDTALIDPAATKIIDTAKEEAESQLADEKRAGLNEELQRTQDLAFKNIKDATIIVFDEDNDAKGRRRTVKVNGARVCGRGRETIISMLFDPTKTSSTGWFFLVPSSAVFKVATKPIGDDPERARWTKAIRVHSVTQAVSITKLIWHGLFDAATEILKEREARIVQGKNDQAVA